MEKALEFAIILTEKHQNLAHLISKSRDFSSQKELRKKQTEISHQIIEFLEDLQEVNDIIMMKKDLRDQYDYLVNYYSKNIYIKIDQYQLKLDLLKFENNFTSSYITQTKNNTRIEDIEMIQQKLNSYYNLIKK